MAPVKNQDACVERNGQVASVTFHAASRIATNVVCASMVNAFAKMVGMAVLVTSSVVPMIVPVLATASMAPAVAAVVLVVPTAVRWYTNAAP